MKQRLLRVMLFAMAVYGHAAVVHVTEQTLAGGRTTVLSTVTRETGARYTTRVAPAISGYVFTHWTMEPSTAEALVNRDAMGRALDAADYWLYEDITLTAHYLPQAEDVDQDGASDGYELYWYGALDVVTGASDPDKDGLSFALELELGTHPYFHDVFLTGGVEVLSGGETLQYNPKNLQYYTIKSNPENKLFATITNLVPAGTVVTTPKCSVDNSQFAYWMQDGVKQVDAMGRALDTVTFSMPGTATELVAVCEADSTKRQSLYWYGTDTVGPTSDTDGDGLCFADELQLGTNPLFADAFMQGGVTPLSGGSIVQFNPNNLQYYIIRSSPENKLFKTISELVAAGTVVTTPTCNPSSSTFAYWTQDGVRQADATGRALDKVTFTMPGHETELVAVTIDDKATQLAQYWYGRADVADSEDIDGDGIGFMDELELGTSPYFADNFIQGGILKFAGYTLEVNLQPYDQPEGVVVDGVFRQLFTSRFTGNGASSETFGDGTQIWPVVSDLNSDGLFDFIVAWEGGCRTFINVGVKGNPEFKEEAFISVDGVDLMMNGTEKLATMMFDIAPEAALSATINSTTLLVSDTQGRIWWYEQVESGESQPQHFQLQHKVWGGTYPGFAEGLQLAVVDWDEDGDLDCLCGTAQGKLMLLKDPTVGQPTGLTGQSGVDNVLLTWTASEESRVKGYNIYRSLVGGEVSTTPIATVTLPTYRDFPAVNGNYDYKVTSISRFYTAGTSTPSVKESVASESIRVTLGTVTFSWNDAQAFLGDTVEIVLAIENSLGVSGDALITVSYDAAVLSPIAVRTTGLTDELSVEEETSASGQWTARLSGDSVATGQGAFLVFTFKTATVCETDVALDVATLKAVDGTALSVMKPRPVKIGIVARAEGEDDPSVVPSWSLGDMNGDGRLTKEDAQILARLKQSSNPKWNTNELRAGDFNGNGKLDNADYQALRALLKACGVLGGGEK